VGACGTEPQEQQAAGHGRGGTRAEGGPIAMSSTSLQRSIHIDAPVEKVFDFVKDPKNTFEAFFEGASTVAEKDIAPDAGEGSVWSWQSHLLFLPFHGTLTRQDYVPNERIVDHSSTGVTWTYTFEPDETATALALKVEVSSPVPYLDKIEVKVFSKGESDLVTWLGSIKKAIET
jgi:uncharacterized protein YndB with AHSA1/START domain